MNFTLLIVSLTVVVGALFVVYRLGRVSSQKDQLKQDVKTGEKSNAILKKQRDDSIDSVDDADSLWNDRKND